MRDTQQRIICTYRSWNSYIGIVIILIYYILALWYAIYARNIISFIVSFVLVILMTYYILETFNKKVEVIYDKIIVHDIWKVRKEYEIKNITRIVIYNYTESKFLKIYIGSNKIKIRGYAKGYKEFLKHFCEILDIHGYTKGGKQWFDVRGNDF